MGDAAFQAEDIISALYEAILERDPDPRGLRHHANALQAGLSLTGLLKGFLVSEEFRGRFVSASANRFPLESGDSCGDIAPSQREWLPPPWLHS